MTRTTIQGPPEPRRPFPWATFWWWLAALVAMGLLVWGAA